MKISDYIMEQNISIASCNDIEIARCFAEMEVIGSLVECYAKQATIMEHAGCDLSDFSIFQEANSLMPTGGSGEKGVTDGKSSFDSKSKETKTKWYKAIWNWIITAFKNLINAMTRVDYPKLIKMVEGSSVNEYNVDRSFIMVQEVIEATREFKNLVKDKDNNPSKYNKIVSDLKSKFEYTNGVQDKLTKSEMVNALKKLSEKEVVPSARKLLKELEFDKNAFKNADDGSAVKATDQTIISTIKDAAKYLSNVYAKTTKSTLQMMNNVIKPVVKDDKKNKKKDGDKK